MKKTYKLINNINKDNDIEKSKSLCKLAEEFGEFAQIINIDLGIKKGSKLKIKDHITEEAADCIQNIFSITNLYNITYDELCKSLDIKTQKWINKYGKN